MIDDPVMALLNRNLSYRARQDLIEIMSESTHKKAVVYENIGAYFLEKLNALQPGVLLGKYLVDKGDITKRKGYETTLGALQYLKNDPNMVIADSARTTEEAIFNLKTRKKEFELGCKTIEHPFVKLLYASISKATMATTSILIGSSYDYFEPDKKKLDIPASVVGLATFNKYCKDGSVDKILRYSLNTNHVVKEGVLDWSLDTIATVGTAIITALRNMVYWVYNTRIDMADYLDQQAMYLELNESAIKSRTDLNSKQKDEIIKKQKKIHDDLLKLSDKIQLDDVKAVKRAQAQADKDARDVGSANKNKDEEDDGTDRTVPDFF